MTDEEKAYFDGMLKQINNQIERILEDNKTFRSDLLNTKKFLIEDSLINDRRIFSMEERIARLERHLKD